MSRARAARAAAVAGLLGLSGCSWFSSSSSPPAATCPNAVILRSLANTAVFGAATARNPENVAFYGLLSEVDRKCDISGDVMHLSLDVIVIGQRGPAGRADSVDFSYFVAVTGPDQSIISKQPFGVRIGFEPNQIRAGVTDHIEETVALAGRKATDLNVLLGFQQSPDVVDFYKHFRGR
ncbi:MAG TPA: hypothetical protein VGR45_14890 [Stellaceae bacterium]|nr:hypothetical protein [Stellaceae bacterium]